MYIIIIIITDTYGSTVASYSYDVDGLRQTKTVGGVEHRYVWQGNKLVSEYWGGKELEFFYDESGMPYAFSYKSSSNATPVFYYYVTNLQGDVVKIITASGTVVANYSYNAWGKLLSSSGTMASVNPIRYRGYYFDAESGFYYLQSRYYDPKICRFISADDPSLLGADGEFISYNLFAYCLNNPINRTDDSGSLSNLAKIAIGVGVIALCAAVTVATAGTGTVLACMAAGALQGAVTGAAVGAATGAAAGAITHRITTGSWEGAGQAASDGAASGFMSGAITGALTGALTSPYCFVAGTLVQTDDGTKPIEEIEAGDCVWAWDEETGEVALKPVLETYVNKTDQLVHVFVNAEEIVSTPGHPFYSPVKGWTDAVHLRAGDILVLVNGEYVVVEKVQHELLEAPIHVYNFNVEGFHTYYVSNTGVLVHNSCRGNAVRKAWKNEYNNVKSGGNGLTRSWSPAERAELIKTGKVHGYQGHHIKSVKGFPGLAGDPTNIQFLTRAEHLQAHSGNWRNITDEFFRIK